MDNKVDGVRERIETEGTTVQSDRDLLILVLGSETQADSLLEKFGSLPALKSRTTAELSEVPGVSGTKATRLQAALELGRRASVPSYCGESLANASAVARLCASIATETNEVFMAVGVNSRNLPMGKWTIQRGWDSGVNLTPRQVFTTLVKEGVGRVIFVHNHPSGDPTPSPEDIRFTKRLIDAAETLDIKVLDHVIVATGGHASLREQSGSSLNFH
jgi:DNA repair protein RadC